MGREGPQIVINPFTLRRNELMDYLIAGKLPEEKYLKCNLCMNNDKIILADDFSLSPSVLII